MTRYGLVDKIEHTIAEAPLLETFMHIISEIPEDEIWPYSVYEEGENGTLIIQQSLHEWLFDFVGTPPSTRMPLTQATTYIIEMTRKDGVWTKEFEAQNSMTVATHIQQDVRKIAPQKNDAEIGTVRYYQKGTKDYRYA